MKSVVAKTPVYIIQIQTVLVALTKPRTAKTRLRGHEPIAALGTQ
jgi:hypothetical protein